jgi:hypothetical protein
LSDTLLLVKEITAFSSLAKQAAPASIRIIDDNNQIGRENGRYPAVNDGQVQGQMGFLR